MMYLLRMTPDDNGTMLVTCPAFPELTTFGANEQDALDHALAAVEEAIAGRQKGDGVDGDPLPRPATDGERKRHKGPWVKLPLLISLKGQRHMAMRDAGVTRAELARRLGWHREQVDRLFRLDHASRIDRIEAAFEKLDRNVDIRVREVA